MSGIGRSDLKDTDIDMAKPDWFLSTTKRYDVLKQMSKAPTSNRWKEKEVF